MSNVSDSALKEEDEKEEEFEDEEDLVAKAETEFFDTIEHAVKLRERKEAERRKQEEKLRGSVDDNSSQKVCICHLLSSQGKLPLKFVCITFLFSNRRNPLKCQTIDCCVGFLTGRHHNYNST